MISGIETEKSESVFDELKVLTPQLSSKRGDPGISYRNELSENSVIEQYEERLKALDKKLELEIIKRIVAEEKITELSKQLSKNIEKLESTNEELDQFAFIASHDLQEPLRKIRMFNDFIVLKYTDKLDEEGQIYLDRMQVACERMQCLIKDILTFSKINVSKDEPVRTDLNELLAEVTANMELRITEKKAEITIDPLPKLIVYPGLIKLLFQQLISNALKFSSSDTKPMIDITAHVGSPPCDDSARMNVKKYWRINIKDNGVGFDQQYADQAFAMFKRLHGNSEYRGTGVGLTICKKIVEEHQGYISVKSAVNEGSSFTISLPVEN